jgi:hypothetical protein
MSKIILKKSSVADKVPLPADLAYGELALNYADSKLFFKKPDNTIGTIGGASGALQNRYSYTATAAQTTFSATYTAPYVDVYLNGLRLSSGVDYVATNGTSVVLTPGAAVNDLVEIVAQVVNIMALVDATKLALTGGTMTGVIGFAAGQTFPGTQTTLVSSTSIKTINGISVLGSGNIQIDGGVVSFNTRTGAVTLSSTDVTTALGFTPVSQSAINSSINAVIDAAPGTLDTLNELAAALGDDPNFATTVTSNIASKLSLSGGSLTGALSVAGTTTATQFTGSGAGLTSIPNSATTATNANTVSTIVARDANGDFLAGGINTARGLIDTSVANTFRILNPGGAAYYIGVTTGAIQIQLPTGFGNGTFLDTVIRMRITVSDFSGQGFEIISEAWPYRFGTNIGLNYSRVYMTTGSRQSVNTRWAWDGTRWSFFIGNIGDSWNYAMVNINDVQVGGNIANTDLWRAGWNIQANNSSYGTVYGGVNVPTLLATNVSGTVAIANGGTGTTTRQEAMDALAGAVTSGQYLRGNGTDVVMSAIQAADVPTLNQSTTGNAATATTLQTARTINGVSFNGSANITVADSTKLPLAGGTLTGGLSGTTATFSGLIKADGGTTQVGSSAGTYRQFRFDGTISADGTTFNTLLHAGNYTSYSPSLTGSGASGTWGISVTGSAASSTLSVIQDTRAAQLTPNDYADYRATYEFTNLIVDSDWRSAFTMKGWNDGYAAWQIIGPSSTNSPETFYLRSGLNTTWNPVRTILHSGNYTSYSPTLTGGSASGTWGINITGNAATATTATNLSGGSINATSASFSGLITGRLSVGTNVNTNNDTGSISVRGDSANAASISFHRAGAYAINMGLGTDNVFVIGGWSASSNAFRMDGSGNLTMLANVTAYSDERVKTNWRDLRPDFIDRLAEVKHGIYDRTDQVSTQVGVSAQSLREILEQAVMENADGQLSVAYGNAALVSAVELAKRVVDQEARIQHLETLINTILNKD